MTPWTLETGFPILLVSDDGSIRVTRFFADGPNSELATTATNWPISVTAIVQGEAEPTGPWILNGPNGDETAALEQEIAKWTKDGLWFKLNAGQTGFFRVSYGKEQWVRLSSAMDPDGPLSIVDRLGLVSDSFAAGKSGYLPIRDALMFISSFGEHATAGKWILNRYAYADGNALPSRRI
jgi:puromycin-sensitive aminopeptidase